MLSLVVVFVLAFVYNKLLDIFPKHQLFYIIGGVYACLFGTIAVMLSDPVHGLPNTVISSDRYLCLVSYCAIESFGSITVSLYWAFVNSTMDVELKKSCYGLINAGAQIGSILGPAIATSATTVGIAKLYGTGAIAMGLMVVMVAGYVRTFGVPEAVVKTSSSSANAGMLEGVKLLGKHAYVRGILVLSCAFMIIGTTIDYLLKYSAKLTFSAEFPNDATAAAEHFASLLGTFGICTNSISFLFSLLGTSMVIRRLGLKLTLLAFPSLVLCLILAVIAVPRLYTFYIAMILLKAFSYSLNNPCKEILYQPTSTAVRFKAKSWIDLFGARGEFMILHTYYIYVAALYLYAHCHV
jgi:ATP:ADP antiporter, AAA family